jgi:hypothetical protein
MCADSVDFASVLLSNSNWNQYKEVMELYWHNPYSSLAL